MGLGTQFMWIMLIIISSGIVFYSLGYNAGKRDGHALGRSVGIRIGERRAREAVNK